jgi:hypothetical protein
MIKGLVYRVKLTADGRAVEGEPVELFRGADRYRDLALNPDGRTIYIATDNAGRTTAPSGEFTQELAHPGAIIGFTYTE